VGYCVERCARRKRQIVVTLTRIKGDAENCASASEEIVDDRSLFGTQIDIRSPERIFLFLRRLRLGRVNAAAYK